jgi:hypothetical protein
VVISAQRNNYDGIPTDGRVDHIRITVYYSFITLPVTLTSFTAIAQNKTVVLNWKTASENNIDNYKLERSADGRNFHPLASIPGLNIMGASYNYTDNFPLGGVSYYRLNIQGNAGYQKYSQTVSVKSGKENLITIFPTIWHQGEDMNITNDNKEKLNIYFFNASGQLITTTTTETKLVPTETLANRSGLIYYKIMDDNKNVLGAGHLLIY